MAFLNIKKIFFVLFLFLSLVSVNGQSAITGVIIDKVSGTPLSFATIIVDNTNQHGTIADVNGAFFLDTNENIQTLICSHVGYETKTVSLNNQKSHSKIIIELTPKQEQLNEIILYTENPAIAIIQNTIAHKEQNNPERLHSFAYKTYSKTVFDIKNKDSLDNFKVFNKSHLFLMESVTKRKFLSPDLDEEEIIGTRLSGFNQFSYAWLATDLQPFSFYEENIRLVEKHYLNPISDGALGKYDYTIESTQLIEKDTIYIITFYPKKDTNADALKGTLYINSDGYAIQNVIAQPAEETHLKLKIQQQYQRVEGQWFPEQLNYKMQVTPKIPNKERVKEMTYFIDGKTYLDSIKINPLLHRKDFKLANVHTHSDANKQDNSFWKQHRKDSLTKIEEKTYQVVDSLFKKHRFEQRLKLIEKLPLGKVSAGVLDIDLRKTVQINRYEALRLGVGLYTNDHLVKNLSFGGYIGYGIKDEQFKYGSKISYQILPEQEFFVKVLWKNDLIETGVQGLPQFNSFSFLQTSNFRDLMSNRFDNVEQASIVVGARSFRYLLWEASINQAQVLPLYGNNTGYNFSHQNFLGSNYNNTYLRLYMRFAYKEKLVKLLGKNIAQQSNYPVFSVVYEKGIKNWWQSDFNYNKIEFQLDQSFYIKNIGLLKYRLESGYINRPLPYGLLFTGRGGFDKKIPFITENYFQTMQPYEFLSDKYINLFLSHNFGSLLYKSAHFQPEIEIHHNLGVGSLSNKETHQQINFEANDKLYLETGFLLQNLMSLNFYNLYAFKVGGGAFFRYGYYSHPKFTDNVSAKIVFQLALN